MKGSKIEIKTLKIELILLKLWGKNTKTRHFPLLRSMNWPEISLFKLHSFKRVCSEVFFKPTSRGRSPAPWDSILPWNLTSNFAHVKTGCFSNYLPLQTHSLKKIVFDTFDIFCVTFLMKALINTICKKNSWIQELCTGICYNLYLLNMENPPCFLEFPPKLCTGSLRLLYSKIKPLYG